MACFHGSTKAETRVYRSAKRWKCEPGSDSTINPFKLTTRARIVDLWQAAVNVVFYLGESGAGPIRPLQPLISAPPVILQSTHEAALDVVDLADLKRRALELS
jgi:hypothetical protein